MEEKTYVTIPHFTGSSGDVSVVFLNGTFQAEGQNKKRFPGPEFGSWLIEQLFNTQQLFAVKKGFLNKKLYCPSCSTELSSIPPRPKQIEYQLTYQQFAPFTIQVTLPSVVCPQCKRVSGFDPKGSVGFHLSEAMLKAFKSENIHP